VGIGHHRVIRDAARAERSVAVTLMAYLVLMRVRANDIHPCQSWSAFALKHHSPGRSALSTSDTALSNKLAES